MSFGDHLVRAGPFKAELEEGQIDPAALRKEIEPWLSAILQSEHLSVLAGSGLSNAVVALSGGTPTSMDIVHFDAPHASDVDRYARAIAENSARGLPNLEDQLRTAMQLLGGLEILGDTDLSDRWRTAIDGAMATFAASILATERHLELSVETNTEAAIGAVRVLTSFLLSFAGRPASRERLNAFTTNYDRIIEYGCEQAGIRVLDRFVGMLAPEFRSSRLEVDMHYNPPGMRGEPRYLEGVIRLTKLHGSIDWRAQGSHIRRVALPFGAEGLDAGGVLDSLVVFPNPAKDAETLEYPYAELFRDFAASICRPNSALVTYGYGFGDDHINRVIRDMLSIPSTHLVVVARSDRGDRIETFLARSAREHQVTLLLGSHLANLENLVTHYLPRPTIDPLLVRKADVERHRHTQGPTTPAGEEAAFDDHAS